ncbi:MAG TPA: class I SAM-dependent methyltransferase [Rhodopseudomonas sp.]|uniref:class I SAM-dependent methyltransferase n=1 Tax=Rhodopseudomonas sp. TaxID=1078 RepID=UPI002ED82628
MTNTSSDDATLKFYRDNAPAYAQRQPRGTEQMTRFLAALPPGGSILELGCGAGYQAAQMIAAGFDVHPTDGSPEMAAQAAQRLGREVKTMLFHELDAVAAYDGVWAYACLLHVPRDELSAVLARIWRALKPGGWCYASFKSGEGEGRDRLSRYYNYPSEHWLRARYAEAGAWASVAVAHDQGKGFDGELASFLHVMAQKPA